MTDHRGFLVAAIVVVGLAVLVALGRTVWPWYRWARWHGPVMQYPGAGGALVTVATGMIWGAGEALREERYDYPGASASVLPDLPADPESQDWLPQRIRTTLSRPADPRPQDITPGGDAWWTGREWVSTTLMVPPSALRHEDGRRWWDGQRWRWLPGHAPPYGDWAPRRGPAPRSPRPARLRDEVRRRPARFPVPHNPSRSDAPPDWAES